MADKNKFRLASVIGKGGEYIVAGQIMLRGLNVAFYAADQGVDLLVENGCRVQVKTAHLANTLGIRKVYPEGVYRFHFPKGRHVATSASKIVYSPRRLFDEFCDVVVLYGIEQNRFWIVPASLIGDRQCLFMGPTNARAFADQVQEMEAMREMGFSQEVIGEHFGISQAAISSRLRCANVPTFSESTVLSVRDCEGAWGHIMGFGLPKYAVSTATKEL